MAPWRVHIDFHMECLTYICCHCQYNFSQIRIVHGKWKETGGKAKNGTVMKEEGVRNCMGEGEVNCNSYQDLTRPDKILFHSWKKDVQEDEDEEKEREKETERKAREREREREERRV